ncbi:hypothetical protein EUTSA_v10012389mg, partial [Eutrema salsugineum]
MSLSFDLMDLETLTSNAKQIQDDVLKGILTLNAHTGYLKRFLHGSFDKELFKKNVPVSYDDVEPYIERVANGEPSDVISGNPITAFFQSPGTSGGKHKIFPMNSKFFENMLQYKALLSPFLSRYVDGAKQEKEMKISFCRPLSKTPSGLPVSGVLSSFLTRNYFKNQSSKLYTSPHDVTLCPDNKQSMYCHLLCGLVQRHEVTCISAYFASTLAHAINFLETHWKELEWITDRSCRDSYIPTLDFYSNQLPIFSMVYASSETIFGINVDLLCKPQDVSYTCLPNMSYFEFIQVDEENKDEIVDLMNVKLGYYYELLVTNYFGLHRYKVGDTLQVTGFYNNAPQFDSYTEITTEERLLKALNHAILVLEASNLMLMGSTCYADLYE